MKKILYLSMITALGIASVDVVNGISRARSSHSAKTLSSKSTTERLALSERSTAKERSLFAIDGRSSAKERPLFTVGGRSSSKSPSGAITSENSADNLTASGSSGLSSWSSSLDVSEMGTPGWHPLSLDNGGDVVVDAETGFGFDKQDVKEIQFEENVTLVRKYVSDEVLGALKDVETIRSQYSAQQAVRAKESLIKLAGKVRKIYLYVQKQMEGRQAELQDIYEKINQSSNLLTEICHYEDFEQALEALTKLEAMLHFVVEK